MKPLLLAIGMFLVLAPSHAQKRLADNQAEKQLMDSMRGPELFKAYCATCHGNDGKGGGPTAKWLKITPADLTAIAVRNGGTFPFLKVQKQIAGEEQMPGAHGTRQMPVWGPILSEVSWDQDLGRMRIYSVTKYLEELQPKRAK